MTAESLTEAHHADESADADDPLNHPLDPETRRREWKKLFDEYQAEHGAFTEEEIAEARKAMYG
ncbi:MAG: hypothetical protein F4017_02680 [Acidimicrobiaceae bacterium]|nr:hypothetical protein [Acidimicrobiaceae bacterium]MYK73490.1 hypothetical protein [Acidimicrobiaceae bacterium]